MIFAAGGVVILVFLLLIARQILHAAPPSVLDVTNAVFEPQPQQPALPDLPSLDERQTESPSLAQPVDSTVTNAATIHRQAFALYDALSKDEKAILTDWRTNVDAAVEAALSEKIRPICNLMHQATALTNCEWGVEPLTYDTKLPHLSPARAIARAAVWSAAHCRANDTTAATDDLLSALQLGRSVSHTAIIGCLVDLSIQGVAWSYVETHLDSFQKAAGQRLLVAFSDAFYEEEPSVAMEQTAGVSDRLVAKLASLPADEFDNQISEYHSLYSSEPLPKMDRTAVLTSLQQVADTEHDLARVLGSGSWDEYQNWAQRQIELENSNPLVKEFLGAYDNFVNRVQREAVTREMMVAALAVAQDGPTALQSYPDPSTGQPFDYTETADGFELQSTYKTNGVPLKMQFK